MDMDMDMASLHFVHMRVCTCIQKQTKRVWLLVNEEKERHVELLCFLLMQQPINT